MADLIIRNHTEIGFTIVATMESHWVSFKACAILGLDSNTNKPLWSKKDSDSFYPVESLEESEVYLSGDVKWDGCSNWRFDEQDRCMLHGCGRQDVLNIGLVLAVCWDMAKELLPNFDGI